ncbi:MAG: putative sulfurtransferase DndC [Mucilaginibacter sp.]|nr:putative sulfurtransferase DndC [Mucilaginibacter sp.]
MHELIQFITEEIQDQYFASDNNTPWIVGFSGGKDSTMLLQLVWYAVKDIPAELRTRKIYVVCNNTLVENPKILEFSERVLKQIQIAASEQSMPVYVNRTTPKLEDTFWVNLIGKGYPSPNNLFRWCTERLKISPTTQFILDKISEEGEAIILLGTRSDESQARARSIKKHAIKGQRLSKHILPKAFVYSPIKDILIDDLWQYLLQVPSPWGSNNKELVTLYKMSNNSGDCPLVIDTTTPSCGNSRFGCWVCTVVKRDRSMEGLIGSGEEWMEPLIDFRNLLAESRDREGWRENRRRNNDEGPGPYTPEIRALFLKELLKAQLEVQKSQPELSLINYQELVAIQVTWYRDSLFNNKVADIYNAVYGTRLSFDIDDDKSIKEKELLKDVCTSKSGDFDLINDLLTLQKTKTLLMNNRGLQNDLENRLDQFIQTGR